MDICKAVINCGSKNDRGFPCRLPNVVDVFSLKDFLQYISLGPWKGGARSRAVTILKVRSRSPYFESARSTKIGPIFARSTPVLNELIPKILQFIAFQIS